MLHWLDLLYSVLFQKERERRTSPVYMDAFLQVLGQKALRSKKSLMIIDFRVPKVFLVVADACLIHLTPV